MERKRDLESDGEMIQREEKSRDSRNKLTPYASAADFDLADLLYRRAQLSAAHIDELLQNWGSRAGASDPPFANHRDLYETIDATEIGTVPWESFNVSWNGERPAGDETPWKNQEFTVYFRDPRKVLQLQLANPDFKFEMDFAPKRVFGEGNSREYMDFMSGNWAWRQAVRFYFLPTTLSLNWSKTLSSALPLLYHFDQIFTGCHLSPKAFTFLGVHFSAIMGKLPYMVVRRLPDRKF
jgi:hypothetical protein